MRLSFFSTRFAIGLAMGGGLGCGAPTQLMSPPPATTEATLVEGGCSATDVPLEGQRVRVSMSVEHGEVWLLLGDERVYGTGEQCVAIDLPDGENPVVIRARSADGAGGVGLGVELASVSATGEHRAFALHCGEPGRCNRDTLRAWTPAERDPCSTIVARGLTWRSGRTSDGAHPEDIEISFILRTGDKVADSGCATP